MVDIIRGIHILIHNIVGMIEKILDGSVSIGSALQTPHIQHVVTDIPWK